MSVTLTSTIYINFPNTTTGPVLTPAGTVVTLGYDKEEELVAEGSATWLVVPTVPTPPAEPGRAIGLTYDANGNIVANVANQTGTLANLLTLAGSDGQIAVATDVNALVKFNGVAGQAVAFYRGLEMGRTTISGPLGQTCGAANAWQNAIFAGGTIQEDTLGAADLANNQIVIPSGVDHYEISWWIEFIESATPSGSIRQGRGMYLSGAVPYLIPNTITSPAVLVASTRTDLYSRNPRQTAITNYRLQYYHDSTVVPTYTPVMQIIMYGK